MGQGLRNLAELLEGSHPEEEGARLRFYRSLVPNAVLLQDSTGFVCGLCGTAHHNRSDGMKCLQTCVKKRRNEGVVTSTLLGESFCCPTCNRRFARREDAIDCHGRTRRLSKVFLGRMPRTGIRDWDDSGFAGLKEADKPGAGRLFSPPLRLEAMVSFAVTHSFEKARPGRRPTLPAPPASPMRASPPAPALVSRPLAPPAKTSQREDPRAAFTPPQERPAPMVPLPYEHREADAVSEAPVSEPPVLASEAPEAGLEGPFRTPGMKAFTRADARYKCTVCFQMFFTRSEVEACFMGHPERPA